MFGLLALLLVVSPPHLRATPGWHVGSTRAHACVGVGRRRCVQAEAWASTVRYRDCATCSPPHTTLARLPPDGIVIQLTVGRERPPGGTRGSWPRRLRSSQVVNPFEGAPARIGVIEFSARTGDGVEHSLFVWFGRAHPTRLQLARANAELRTAR
jgi:hypothetical protein